MKKFRKDEGVLSSSTFAIASPPQVAAGTPKPLTNAGDDRCEEEEVVEGAAANEAGDSEEEEKNT